MKEHHRQCLIVLAQRPQICVCLEIGITLLEKEFVPEGAAFGLLSLFDAFVSEELAIDVESIELCILSLVSIS